MVKMKKVKFITEANKNLIKNFYKDFIRKYNFDVALAFVLLICAAKPVNCINTYLIY